MKLILFVSLLISISYGDCRSMYLAYHVLESNQNFNMEDYIFGEENCCDEYPISFCSEDRVFYVKEDYADINDPENWDILSESVALLRGDNEMLYNPIEENGYVNGLSPSNTLWKSRSTYDGNSITYYDGVGVLAISYVPRFLPGSIGSIYSIPDDEYYDIYFTSWTSGGGTGWPGGGGNGDGGGAGGGVAYWRSGPIDAAPEIMVISDVPDDNGGRVYININRSYLDVDDHPNGLDLYSVQRLDAGDWVNIGSFGAQNNAHYIYEATTLRDSSSQDHASTGFKVIGQTFSGDLIFESEIEYGYSLDNIAPEVPGGFSFVYSGNELLLMWDSVPNEDFNYYALERDVNEEFNYPQRFETIEPYYEVSDYNSEEDYFYRVYAVDIAGNRSDYSVIINATALSNNNLDILNDFSLNQNYPNPFNPITRIDYNMPENGKALIEVIDVKGYHIRTLVNDYVQIGSRSIVWDARNDNGEKVPAGIYFYTFKSNNYIQTQKMVLLK